MEITKSIITLPRKANKIISYKLYTIEKIYEEIENRKEELIDRMRVTNRDYLISLHRANNTLEDIIIRFDTDRKIKSFKLWEKIINDYMKELKDEKKLYEYYFIIYRYFKKKDDDFLISHLKITKSELIHIDLKIKKEIYIRAKKAGLIEEVTDSVRV